MQILLGNRRWSLVLSVVSALLGVWIFLLFGRASAVTSQGALPDLNLTPQQNDLEIDQKASAANVVAGDVLVYSIWITNSGSSVISGAELVDTWVTDMGDPENVASLWDYGILPRFNGWRTDRPAKIKNTVGPIVDDLAKAGEIRWQLEDLAVGDHLRIVFSVTVPITVQPTIDSYEDKDMPWRPRYVGPSTVENFIEVSVPGETPWQAPKAPPAQVVAPLLEVTQRADGEVAGEDLARVGRLVTYTIQVHNVSRDERPDTISAKYVRVQERIPQQLRPGFIEGSIDAGLPSGATVTSVYSATSGQVLWTISEILPGQSAYLTYTARVPLSYGTAGNDFYNDRTDKYLVVDAKDDTEDYYDLLALANAMPFRKATLPSDHKVEVLSPFDKLVKTSAPPDQEDRTFPNRIITYTLTFYNPVQTEATVLLVDQLPTAEGMPVPFSYVRSLEGDITDLAASFEISGSQLQWTGVPVAANGSVSETFEVLVSPHTPLGANCLYAKYANGVTAQASAFGFYQGHDGNELAVVEVEPEIKITKEADPETQFPGYPVTYTVMLENVGDRVIDAAIALTDVMPVEFKFHQMLTGPVPITRTDYILFWPDILSGGSLAPGESFTFAYQAIVDGDTTDSKARENLISGYCEQTSICTPRPARVKLHLPLKTNKTAGTGWMIGDTPAVVQGQTFSYTVDLWNIAPDTAYTLTAFADILDELPDGGVTGFWDPASDSMVYTHTVSPPHILQPGGDPWQRTFDVLMRGAGTDSDWCRNLGKPNKAVIEQPEEAVEFYGDDWVAYNADELGPVHVLPHVSLYQHAYPNPVAIGQEFTVTLMLRDNRVEPLGAVTGITLAWRMDIDPNAKPTPFEVLASDPPYDADASNDTEYIWKDLSVSKAQPTEVVLRVRAPVSATLERPVNYSSMAEEFIAEVLSLNDPEICIPRVTRFVEGVMIPSPGEEELIPLELNQGLEVNKEADLQKVGPYQVVEFTLEVANQIGMPVGPVVITDILPTKVLSNGEVLSWEFVNSVEGFPAPDTVQDENIIWNVGTITAEEAIELRFRARSYASGGYALNRVEVGAPIHWGLDKDYEENARVFVSSGIGFFKVAEPDTIQAGELTTYTVTLYNGSDTGIASIVVTDTLPEGFTFVEMKTKDLTPVQTDPLVWVLRTSLLPNEAYYIVFTARADADLFLGTYYSELDAYATRNDMWEPVAIPSTGATAPVKVRGESSIGVSKRVSPQTVKAGQDVTYTITLVDETDGEGTLTLQVVDVLPEGVTFVEGLSPATGVSSQDGQRVVWSDLTLAPEQTRDLVFKARVDRMAEGTYYNMVQVTMNGKLLPANRDLAPLTVTPLPRVDGQVNVADGQLYAQAGDVLNYTLHYTNSSELTLQDVVLTANLSPITYLMHLQGPGWVSAGRPDRYTLDLDTLAPGATGSTTFTAKVVDVIPDEVDVLGTLNWVDLTYTAAEDFVEVNTENNSAFDANIVRGPDLIVTNMWVASDNPRAGEPIRVHATLKNQGVSDARYRWDGHDGATDGWLYVAEVFAKPSGLVGAEPPSDPFDHVGGYCADEACTEKRESFTFWAPPLAVQETSVVTFELDTLASGRYNLYTRVDSAWPEQVSFWGKSFGLVKEAVEVNNVYSGPLLDVGERVNSVYMPVVLRKS